MDRESFTNTQCQTHVPINLSKCYPTASTRLIILLNGVDEISLCVSADVSNYVKYKTQHMIILLSPLLVCRGSSWTSPTSSRKVTNVTM